MAICSCSISKPVASSNGCTTTIRFEDDAVFASLEIYAFATLRVELVAQRRIPKKAVAAVFERLGFGWAEKLIR